MGMNKVFLLGNLGSDPELRYTPNTQQPVCSFRLATTEQRKTPEGERVEQTEWHSIVVWGKQGENCKQYLSKGRQAFIEGRLQTRKWQDQQGNNRYTTEIVALNVQFIGSRDSAGGSASFGSADPGTAESFPGGNVSSSPQSSGSPASSVNAPISFEDDDIPF